MQGPPEQVVADAGPPRHRGAIRGLRPPAGGHAKAARDPYGPTSFQFTLGAVVLGGGAAVLGLLAWKMFKAPLPEDPEEGFRARKISAPEARPMAMNRTWSVAPRGRSAALLRGASDRGLLFKVPGEAAEPDLAEAPLH